MPIKRLLRSLSREEISRPVFILGCGRSGTTIFGKTLSRHNSITYLNERRELWFAAYPETDIWTSHAPVRNGRMNLTSEYVETKKSIKLRRLFHQETLKTSKPILLEKLPINNFRVTFIHSIFPDARFIHIYRSGLEVARSIQKMCEEGDWFGTNDYKWKQLIDYSKGNRDTVELPELCESYYHKGLLEWRLSTESTVKFLDTLPKDKYIEVSYATLTKYPIETIRRVLTYIGISEDPAVVEFATENISRRTSISKDRPLTDLESRIGGKLLPLSIESTCNGLSRINARTE